MSVSANQQAALDYYYNTKKLTKDCCVGIVAVLTVESSVNPLSENNSGTENGGVINPKGSYGVAQWNGPRQQALSNFAANYKLDVSQLDTQLWFVLTEAANNYPQFWAKIQDVSAGYTDVITAMVNTYEVPADKTGEINKAVSIAQGLYSSWAPTSVIPTAPTTVVSQPTTPSTIPTVAFLADFLALLQKYGVTLN